MKNGKSNKDINAVEVVLPDTEKKNNGLGISMTKTFDSDDSSDDDGFSIVRVEGEGGDKKLNITLTSYDDDGEDYDDDYHKEKSSTCSILKKCIEYFKYLYSSVLLIFSVFLIMAAIFTEQTVGTAEDGIHPVLAFFVFWFMICWLGMMEGGQGCLVGLAPIDPTLYEDTHPITCKNTSIVNKGDNLERFIVGRQFLVVLVVFLSSMMCSPIPDVNILNLPELLQSIMLSSGFALIFTTICIGQLSPQVNAANCMLDFINSYFMLYFVTYVSLIIEFSGLLHCVYLVQVIFSMISGQPIDSNEPPRTVTRQIFFWGRAILSISILGFAFAVTLSALFAGQTTMWEGVPPTVSVIIFFVLMGFVGIMEGIQIALFAVVNLPEQDLALHPRAYKNCRLTFDGNNLKAFLIGRQILVTMCMFIVAQISTLSIEIGVDKNIFGVSDGVQAFFNTGLLGAVITTIVASLAWRVVASSFPLPFLSNPLIYIIIRLCLVLEASGLCSAAWVLAAVQRRLIPKEPDDVYLEMPNNNSKNANITNIESMEFKKSESDVDGDDLEKGDIKSEQPPPLNDDDKEPEN